MSGDDNTVGIICNPASAENARRVPGSTTMPCDYCDAIVSVAPTSMRAMANESRNGKVIVIMCMTCALQRGVVTKELVGKEVYGVDDAGRRVPVVEHLLNPSDELLRAGDYCRCKPEGRVSLDSFPARCAKCRLVIAGGR